MQDKDRTKEQLTREVTALRQRVAELEAMDTQRQQAEGRLQSQMRRQAALLQLSADLTTSLDEAEICQTVVRGLHDGLGYDYMSLFLVDQASGDRLQRASVGWPDVPPDWRLAAGQGLSERPLLDGQLHYTPDVTREPRYVPGIDGRSEVDVPLRVDDRILGVLVVESTHLDAFDQDDFAVLTAAANQAAVALERAREHQAVREAEIRYQSLFDRVPVELYRSTPAGQLLDVNPAMARMLGYPDRESLLAVNASDLYVDAEDQRRWQAALEQQDLVRDFEAQMRRYDGSIIMARDSARAIRDAQGQVLYYEGGLEDITERKRAEEALQQSEEAVRWWAEALEALQATVLDITVPHDLSTLLETIVERAARLLNAPTGGLYLCDPDKEQVRCVVSHNTPSDYRGTVLQYGEGAAGLVAQTGRPLIIDDYGTWYGRASVFEAEQPFAAVLTVPLIWQGQVTGVVDVVGYAEGQPFTQADLELLTLFANHAAIAVENTRLYEQAQQEIAERKQLEQQIEERRLYLERVLACAPDAIVTMDAQHRILGWNQGAERLFGYPPEEVIGRDLDEIITAPDTATSREAIRFTRQALAGQPVPPIETIRYRKDGTPADVILAGAPILVDDTLVGTVAVYTDITERKRAEEALRESEELYRTLVQTSPDAVTATDLQGTITYASPRTLELHGFECEEELLGKNAAELIAPEHHQIAFASMEKTLREGFVRNVEYTLTKKDGTRFAGGLDAALITDAQGNPKGFIATTRDITERKRAEEEVRRLKEFNEGIVQNMAEGIAVQDAEGYLTFLNPAAATLLGYTPEELVGQYWTLVVPPDQQPTIQAADERRARGQADRYEVELLGRDGERVPVLISGSPRFDAATGRFAGTLAVFTDISERRQAEEKLTRRAQEMVALYETSLEINAQPDLPTLLQAIVRRAAGLLGARMGGLYLLQPDNLLELMISHNLPGDHVGSRLRPGEGLSGRVAQSGEPMMVPDYQAWEGRAAVFAADPFRRALGVPLKLRDRVIGVITITDEEQTGPFDEDEIRLVSLFADQAAIAIENARLLAAEARRRRESETLRAATQALTATLDLQQVFELILRELRQVVPYDSASVQQLKGERLEIIGGHGFPNLEELLGVSFDLQARDNPNREVIRSREPLILEDAPVRYAEFKRRPHAPAGIRSWLGVPLLFGDRLIGMIALDKREPGFYTEDHARLVMAFAAQAAIAVENARLFQAQRDQRDLAEALRQATAAISSSLDLDQVLDQILEQVSRVIPSDTTNVMLIESGHARIVRWRGYDRFGQGIDSVAFRIADTPSLRHMQETGQPLVISDTATDPDWVHLPEVPWIRSYIGVPIRIRDQVIGFLNVDSATPGFFKPANADQVRAFADQASLALENARFFEETSRRAEQMATLNRIGLAITSDLNLEEVLNTLYEQIKRILDVGAFYVALYDEDTGLIQFPLLTGVTGPAHLEPLHLDRNSGLTGHIIRSAKPLYIPDTRNLPEEAPYRPVRLIDLSTRSYIGVPLIFRERVMGVLSIQSYEPDAYTDADVALLMTIATQATIAIENARLYDEARQRNQELALLNRVIAASAVSSDVEAILETVCRELALALDLPQAAAALLNANGTEAVVVAEYLAEGRPPALGETIPVAGNPSFHYLLEQKKPLVVEDAQSDPRLAPIHDLERRRGTVTLLLLPLVVEGEVAGSLGVDAIEPRSFTAEEVDLAWRVANQVSSALARARLEETQRRLSIAVEQAADVVVITGTDGTILYVNPAFERVTGFSRAEVIGQGPQILRGSALVAAFHQRLWQAVMTGEVWQERMNNVRQDGTPYTLDLTVSPVRNQAGEIVNYVGTMRDVTREVQLERQFQQSQKMEALGRLAGGIAHDFNNLLTVIHLSIRLLDRHLRPEDPLWEHVRRIEETGERAAKLTKQLLSFSRREIIEPRVLDLNEVVRDLDRMLQRIIGEDVELETTLAEDLWSLKMDPSQVEQVIMNLVVNARDAMPSGGTLTIQTANVTLDEAYAASQVDVRAGEYVLLSIQDTGLGMDDDVKAHLFEPFFTTKERGQGTGLGLPTVFGVVKQNEGHAEVHSEVGRGTTFRIYLPRVKEAEGSSGAKLPAGSPGLLQGTETVLVVEDEPTVRNLAARVLASCGYQVLAASDGPQALEIGEQHEGAIHLLLTDVILPRMSGKELADRLQKQRPETQVLFVSGYTDDAITHHGVLAPGTAFLAKPFTVEDLTQKVRSVLDSPA